MNINKKRHITKYQFILSTNSTIDDIIIHIHNIYFIKNHIHILK